MRRIPGFELFATVGALLAIAAGFGIAWSWQAAPTRLVQIGQSVHQDDFSYTVIGVSRTTTIGTDGASARAAGIFYVVSIGVENDAKRVAFRWDPSMVVIEDAAGHRYGFDPAAQSALERIWAQDHVVDAGTSHRFDVVFDLPRDIVHPALAFENGFLMGDLFDGAAYAKARVPLD